MACKQLDWSVYLLLALALLILPLKWLFAVVLAVTVHELGHYAALRLCGVRVSGLCIGVDGVRMEVGQMERWQEFFCALSGPVAGFFLLLLSRWLPRTAVCACIQSAYNLLPVYPLDGGRVLRCLILSDHFCVWIERFCLALIAAAGLYGFVWLELGLMPLIISALTIHRALIGKRVANGRGFRYNRERIYK